MSTAEQVSILENQVEELSKNIVMSPLYFDRPDVVLSIDKTNCAYVSKVCMKLAPSGVEIGSLWGSGYAMNRKKNEKIHLLEATFKGGGERMYLYLFASATPPIWSALLLVNSHPQHVQFFTGLSVGDNVLDFLRHIERR